MSNLLKNLRLFFLKCLAIFIIISPANTFANASEDISKGASWIMNTITSLMTKLQNSCIHPPDINHFKTGSIVADLTAKPQWQYAGHSVHKDQMLKIQWNSLGIESRPRKYMILYRIDPRFTNPQLFIVQYNYITQKYESDFRSFEKGSLLKYQTDPMFDFANRGTKYNNYFNFESSRKKLVVDPGDVVNITLSNMADLASIDPGLIFELTPSDGDVMSIFTTTGIGDNKILYTNASNWCKHTSQNTGQFPDTTCITDTTSGTEIFAGPQNSYKRFVGIIDALGPVGLPSCDNNIKGFSPFPLCMYDKGRGMTINIGTKEVKSIYTPFVHSPFSGRDFFYYRVGTSGYIDFRTSFDMKDMFLNFPQNISNLGNNPNYSPNLVDMRNYLSSENGYIDTMMKYLHVGRYVMFATIGNSDALAGFSQQNDIKISYQILPPGATAPADNSQGILVEGQEYTVNAPQDGNLWIKVENPHTEVAGEIRVSYAYYTGSTVLSNVLYNSIALPIMNMMRSTAKLFYMGIALNPTWQLTVRTLLTLYIIIYGLSYLAGKIQVKTYDVFTRIAKLAVVFAMFSPSSWKFFNENVFVIFLDGMSYLTYSVIGLTSDVSNIFGFVDIIFDKYTNLEVWEAILISLLQIHNGMTYIAILLIEAILSYLVAVIDVVVSYIMAFLTICVLISLAPLFIVCMLFERTRSMFDSWVSLLFNYMIQPTVLLIFFLLIDQLMAQQFAYVLIKSCWGWLIELNIDLDLREIIPGFRVKFDLPFLPGIPFFIPALSGAVSPFVNFGGEITRIAGAVLMFKIYAQLASGLVEYSINLVATLTGSRPGRKAGREQSASNPVQAITQELKAPFVAVKDRAKGFGKGLYKASKEGYRNPEESDSKKNDSKKSEALKKRDESSAPSPKMGTAKDIDE